MMREDAGYGTVYGDDEQLEDAEVIVIEAPAGMGMGFGGGNNIPFHDWEYEFRTDDDGTVDEIYVNGHPLGDSKLYKPAHQLAVESFLAGEEDPMDTEWVGDVLGRHDTYSTPERYLDEEQRERLIAQMRERLEEKQSDTEIEDFDFDIGEDSRLSEVEIRGIEEYRSD